MRRASSRRDSERGAILVVVASTLLVFTALSALVINYGVQLLARSQIQNTVDAAALAGATALAFDSYADRTNTGPAHSAAAAIAARNLVWGEAPGVAGLDVGFPVCASTYEPGASGAPIFGCIQVTAYRHEARGNPIAPLFASLLGTPSYGVAATAIAEAKSANATDCLRPIAIPDRWTERYPVNPGAWTSSSTFDKVDPMNPPMLLPPGSRDAYKWPDRISPETGFTMDSEFGVHVTLRPGSLATPISTISPWLYLPVQIPGSQWGENDVRRNTASCAAAPIAVGATLGIAPGGVAANAPLVGDGLLALYDSDPGATWNTATRQVDGSCADPPVRCAWMSPRIIALALYDPNALADASQIDIPGSVLVRNIVGFFIESVSGVEATGYITRHPGLRNTSATLLTDAASFLRTSTLVQ